MVATVAPMPPAPGPPLESEGRRHLRPRPVAVALIGLAALASLLWLGTRQKPQLAVAAAIVVAVIVDAVVARLTLASLELDVRLDSDLIAGQPSTWILSVGGVRRPVVVGPSVALRSNKVRVSSEAPGRITLPPLSRGVARSLFFDVTTIGPAGLFEAGRRYRVRLGAGLLVGPAALAQPVDWPRPRAVRFGVSDSAPIGDDLFRSVRHYVRGDSRRRMHWKATAHHGRLMVSERDGTGVVALRIVVPLPAPGAVADVVVGRAAWVAEQALRRGWLVHLVTRAPAYLPPEAYVPLASPFGMPPPVPVPIPVPDRTIDHQVTSRAAIREALALAGPGQPSAAAWRGLTCVVGTEGLEWR